MWMFLCVNFVCHLIMKSRCSCPWVYSDQCSFDFSSKTWLYGRTMSVLTLILRTGHLERYFWKINLYNSCIYWIYLFFFIFLMLFCAVAWNSKAVRSLRDHLRLFDLSYRYLSNFLDIVTAFYGLIVVVLLMCE